MNIIKPKNFNMDKSENASLCDLHQEESWFYCSFENEKCDNITLYGIEFGNCCFNNICMQNAVMEKVTFSDVVFERCNFSNAEFLECTFIRCEFKNCKAFGSSFTESRLHNVSLAEVNGGYAVFSMDSIENIMFRDTALNNCCFQENKVKNLYFENADLTQARFFKTSLKDVDLSSSKIEKIAVLAEDIRGAVIDQFQAVDLLYLIGVKLK